MDHGLKALNHSNWIDKQCLSHYILRMRIKGSLSKVLLIAVAVSLIPVTAFSAPKITPGHDRPLKHAQNIIMLTLN
jgi:hypothetical protein